jgi:hypothetical protein
VAPKVRQGDEQAGRVMATYLPADLAAALRARAQSEERSVSQVIRRTLRSAMADTDPARR